MQLPAMFLSVCLSVSKITKKRVHGFAMTFCVSIMDELINF